ncbi:MAG: RnfABCDGE type electron transport complex subunit G [Bacteroidales bacterium]|nr:RnfABCDGE type electron transport complex subunit G [Bacteroidales bacterium]MDD4209528.1 RnfABCDGE type electron transport complex subunit G [Bacteroidales bacterium]
MAKIESSFKNMLLVLCIISVVAAVALAAVYGFTKAPIEQSRMQKQQDAIKMVLPPFDKIEEEKIPVDQESTESVFYKEMGADSITLFHAFKDGKEVGIAVETFTNKGFSGKITLMAGFTVEGNIHKVQVLTHAETPGLGTKMAESPFKDQFEGKDPQSYKLSVSKDGGDVDAITAATISSRAYCDAMQTAYKVAFKNKDTH